MIGYYIHYYHRYHWIAFSSLCAPTKPEQQVFVHMKIEKKRKLFQRWRLSKKKTMLISFYFVLTLSAQCFVYMQVVFFISWNCLLLSLDRQTQRHHLKAFLPAIYRETDCKANKTERNIDTIPLVVQMFLQE